MQRPLVGEPLAVDLVNTCWLEGEQEQDLLATLPGLAQWLAERGLDPEPGERLRRALVHTRSVLRRAFDDEPDVEEDVNAVLARAVVVRGLHAGQVEHRPVFADESWRLPWLAVDDYLTLRSAAGSIRQCQHPSCVLYFHDPTGRRRWCSMAVCGNRAKARRHYVKRQRDDVAGAS